MATTTIRIRHETWEKLQTLSRSTHQPMASVLEQALDALTRERFFADLDAAYDVLWSDPAAREEEMAERRLFEGAPDKA